MSVAKIFTYGDVRGAGGRGAVAGEFDSDDDDDALAASAADSAMYGHEWGSE